DLATAGVRDAIDGPVEELASIVRHVQIDFERRKHLTTAADWERSRRANLRLYLAVLQRLSSSVERKFDFNQRLEINLTPPGGDYLPGISPKSIREPEIRKAYEKALEENRKKFATYDRQVALRDHEKSLLRSVELGTVGAYSIEPMNLEE